MASDRLAMMSRLMRAGEPVSVSRSARSLWWILAVGYANVSEGGRCWPSRAVVMERLGRAHPGRVAEHRVIVPASVCVREAGGIQTKRARQAGGMGAVSRALNRREEQNNSNKRAVLLLVLFVMSKARQRRR